MLLHIVVGNVFYVTVTTYNFTQVLHAHALHFHIEHVSRILALHKFEEIIIYKTLLNNMKYLPINILSKKAAHIKATSTSAIVQTSKNTNTHTRVEQYKHDNYFLSTSISIN